MKATSRAVTRPRSSLKVTPQDLALRGLHGGLGAIMSEGWARLPTYYYDMLQHRFPLTQEEFDSSFGGSQRIFSLGDSDPGHQTNAAVGSGVNEIFLAMGAGIVAIGEGEAFALQGVATNRPSAASATPQVIKFCNAETGGCETGLTSSDSSYEQAVLYYGGPTQRFIEKFFQAFRLQILVNRRFLLVDESLFDVGMVPAPPEFGGASSSELSAMPFIREVNDVMADKDIDRMFLPMNLVNAGLDTPVSQVAAPPMAGVTYGHNRIIGLSNRLYCFTQPIMFLPGMSFDVEFVPVENDISFKAAMQAISVLDPDNATVADAKLTESIAAAAATFKSGVMTIPGGTLSLGLVFKGFALQPAACLQYLAEVMTGGSALAGVYAGSPHLAGIVNRENMALAGLDAKLSGMLSGLMSAKNE
jgi:hypothetical protein